MKVYNIHIKDLFPVNMYHYNPLTEGKIFKELNKFTWPFMFSMLLQTLYGAIDLLIVGQFADSRSVSGVATGTGVMAVFTGVIVSLTSGGTIIIGQLIGAKKYDDAGKTTGAMIILFSVMSIVLTVVMLTLSRQIASVMQSPPEAFTETVNYIFICSLGIIFIVAFNEIGAILRGLGDSKTPLIIIAIACVINIAGDLLLVGVFGMAASGAAWATIFAQSIAAAISLFLIKKKRLPFELKKAYFKFDKKLSLWILKIGFPIAMQDTLTNFSFLVIAAILNSMGLIFSAAMGAVERIIGFAMLPPAAYMTSVSVMTAQNVGANKPDRAKKTVSYGILCSGLLGLAGCIACWVWGDYLMRIFSRDPEVIAAGVLYLKTYSLDCIMIAPVFCLMGFFTGYGKTFFVMVQGLAATFLVRLPVSYFMSRIPGATMMDIGWAAPSASFLSLIICLIYLRSKRWKQGSLLESGPAAAIEPAA